MSHRNLRALMKIISPPEQHTLKDCCIVVDGRSFFKDSYKKSGCQSIFGGEYDRYADYLKNLLQPFIKCNITCHVIFNGGMEADLRKRTEIHQKVINNAQGINPADKNAYCEPIFIKDVWKEVLEELGIKYYITEHDSWDAIFGVARFFHCPILTKNYEYSLAFQDCISPKSLVYYEDTKTVICEIYKSENVRKNFRVKHKLLPLFYTLLDESKLYFKKLSVIVDDCLHPKKIVSKVLRWTRWQADNLDETMTKIEETLSEEELNEFFNVYGKNIALCKTKIHRPAVKHFSQKGQNGSTKIPIPYVNLIRDGTFSGSWVIFDEDQEDAMLPVMDIIFYACKCFEFRKDDEIIVFIGRQNSEPCVWEIERNSDEYVLLNVDLFRNFVCNALPGFDFNDLESVPEECWILIVALVYYCKKRPDRTLAYSVILSYVMLGPVSQNVGLIKRTNFISPEVSEIDQNDVNGLNTKDCVSVVQSMLDMFYVNDSKKCFDRKILHTFAEFQHCLQHMNYLNELCGRKIKGTAYHKTINATFAYNTYLKIQNKSDPKKYLEKRLKKSTVFNCYNRIENVFENCLCLSE